MKVLVVGTRGIPDVQGGIESHCQQLYPRLVKLGYEVTIVGRRRFLAKKTENYFQGCKIVPTDHFKGYGVEAFFHSLVTILFAWKYKPNVIHIHAIGPSIVLPIARIMGYKTVMTHHGMDYRREKWGTCAKWVLRCGERLGSRYANAVISISSEITMSVRKITQKTPVYQIPNGVELPSIESKGANSPEFIGLGLESEKYILALGRFVPEKNFHTLVDAWKSLPSGSCKLVIAGAADHESPYSREFQESAKKAGVILPGYIKGVLLSDLFRNATGFVIPSTHEGLPIALLEAMSYDLQVLASDILPHLELKLESQCYYKVDAKDELVKALQNMLQQNSRPKFRELLQSTYNWDLIAQKTAEVYQNVMR